MQSIQAPDSESKTARTNAERQRNWRRRQAAKREAKRAAQEALAIAAVEERIAHRRVLGLPMLEEEMRQRRADGESFESVLKDMRDRLPAVVDEVEEDVPFEKLMSMNRGLYLTGAPAGRGKLVSGGYGPAKIESIVTPSHTAYHENGTRRVQPRGFGPDE
jgi:hypothetical protein